MRIIIIIIIIIIISLAIGYVNIIAFIMLIRVRACAEFACFSFCRAPIWNYLDMKRDRPTYASFRVFDNVWGVSSGRYSSG